MRKGEHPFLQLLLIGVVLSAIGIAIGLSIDWFPLQASTAAHKIDTLYDVLVIASVPVFVLVMTVAIYSVIRFRARPGDLSDGAPIHGNTRLEVVWVTIPFLLVSGLAGYAWVVLDDIEAKEPNTMTVNVRAQQFAWRFSYPGEGKKVESNDLVVPLNRHIKFNVRTNDVIHDFWVPEFRLKTDAVPGLTTNIRVTPDRIGHYQVVCAELCGLGHSTMRASVRVVRPPVFTAWLAKRRKQGNADVGGDTPPPPVSGKGSSQ
jgi:cytochrome c oxidase subunit 2